MLNRIAALLAGSTLAIVLAACAVSSGGASAPAPTITGTLASAEPAASTAVAAGTKVSANTASQAEIATALAAAGVPNADRWAREVTEYRPYPTDDATLARLQENLAKYNPDPATLQGILAALKP